MPTPWTTLGLRRRPSRRRRSGRRGALLGLALGLAALLAPAAPGGPLAAAASEPERFIGALGERTVAALSEPGADQARRVAAVAGLLDEAADLDLIARLVLGRHWRAASEAQRREYVRLFHAYARDSLAQRFGGYTGSERFRIVGSRPAGEGDTLVSTQVTFGGGQPPVAVDWRVRPKQGGKLVIVDVVAEGVSLLVTNRSEFDAIVGARGVDGLLEEMRRWRRAAGPRPGPA